MWVSGVDYRIKPGGWIEPGVHGLTFRAQESETRVSLRTSSQTLEFRKT